MRTFKEINMTGNINEDEIKEILQKKYQKHYGGNYDRELRAFESKASGCFTFYALAGTPPKGYAIFVNQENRLYFYDKNGDKFKSLNVYKINNKNMCIF